MNSSARKKIKDVISVFVYLNKYAWPILRHEVFFILLVDLFGRPGIGLKAGKVTEVLKRGNKIKPSDRNKTWAAGKKLIEDEYLESPKSGYYRTTPRGHLYVYELIRDMSKHFNEFKLYHF